MKLKKRFIALKKLLSLLQGFFPLTLAGIVLAGASWWGYQIYGVEQADVVIHTATLTLLALLGATTSLTLFASLFLFVYLKNLSAPSEELRFDVGAEVKTGFRFPSLWLWPLVEVNMRWADEREMEVHLYRFGGSVRETLVARERGYLEEAKRSFVVSDIFGLSQFRFSLTLPIKARIAPAMAEYGVHLPQREAAGDGHAHPTGEEVGDLVEIRRYAPGDPMRLVLWKIFARSRRLMVRAPERAVAPQTNVVAFMLAGEDDEASASTARTFIEHGMLGEAYRFFADGAEAPTSDAQAAVEVIIGSKSHRARGGEGLPRLLQQVDRQHLGHAVIFVPSTPGPWVSQLAAFAAAIPSPPTIIIAVDGEWEEKRRRGAFLKRGLKRRGKQQWERLPQLLRSLEKLGGPVQILHRPSGRTIDAETLSRMTGGER